MPKYGAWISNSAPPTASAAQRLRDENAAGRIDVTVIDVGQVRAAPALEIERERAVLIEQARESGKPENIIEKMVEGRLRKFYEEVCLLEQVFVIDGEGVVRYASGQAPGLFEYYGNLIKETKLVDERTRDDGRIARIVKEPVGVVAAITPWNFPAAMITRKCRAFSEIV